MAISNWRAWYERNYQKETNGPFFKEKRELGQLQSVTDNFPNAYFTLYKYDITVGNIMDAASVAGYPSYKPGDVFLQNYYDIYDMFTNEEIEEFCKLTKEDYLTYREENYVRFMVPSKVFWAGPAEEGQEFGMYYVPFISSYQQGAGSNPNIVNHGAGIGFGFLTTRWNPLYLGWDWVWNSTHTGGLTWQNQNLIRDTDYSSVEGAGSYGTFYVPYGNFRFYSNPSDDEEYFGKVVDNFKAFIKKLKCYPVFPKSFDTTRLDGIDYFKSSRDTTVPTVTPGQNWIKMLYDMSECPFVPASGFSFSRTPFWSNSSTMRTYHGFIVDVTRNGGPDSKNPDEKDDPNDEDPGPGDDSGGDGDHNNITDPVPIPGVPTLSGSGVGLFTIFNPTFGQLAQLGSKLWTPGALDLIKQYFSNPMECIIGLGIIPVQPRTGSSSNIHLGLYDTEISAPVVDSDYVIKDCGTIPITRYYGSYLDYDPYTRISLYLPYIGEIDIDPDQVMQTNLGVTYYVNVVTGDIVAMITSNGNLIYTVAGNCMRQLPIAQADFSAIINTAVSAVTTIASAGVSASAAKSVQGTVAGGAKSEAGRSIADARANASINNSAMGAGSSVIDQVMSTKMKYHHAGDIGTGSGQLTYQTPYLTIERPNLMLADNYKSYVGYPCNQTIQLNNCTGFTQIEATRLSIPGATDEEVNEILQHLVEGVII